ncbi:MAG: LamG domain-containing protein [Halofilum sp. (in: g-proteobacteria)]|nr:LamG domain-containing protein [Halofilum sp. (in: g-proteobacteria)]
MERHQSARSLDQTGNGRDGTAQGGAAHDRRERRRSRATPAPAATARSTAATITSTWPACRDIAQRHGARSTFWIRTTQTGDDTGWQAPGVTGVEEAGGADDIFWGWIDGSGRIGISVANDYDNEQKSSSAINDGNWHHVALTRDASSGETKVYIDGALESTGNSPTGTIGNAFSSLGRIEDTGGTPEYLDGDLDEVRVYDDVLTDSDVSSDHRATVTRVHSAVPWRGTSSTNWLTTAPAASSPMPPATATTAPRWAT